MTPINKLIPWMCACGVGAWLLAGCATEGPSPSHIDKQPFGTADRKSVV